MQARPSTTKPQGQALTTQLTLPIDSIQAALKLDIGVFNCLPSRQPGGANMAHWSSFGTWALTWPCKAAGVGQSVVVVRVLSCASSVPAWVESVCRRTCHVLGLGCGCATAILSCPRLAGCRRGARGCLPIGVAPSAPDAAFAVCQRRAALGQLHTPLTLQMQVSRQFRR